jgi:hypothetical protein
MLPVTAVITTLFHNRHAIYGKYTEKYTQRRLRSTTDQPPYVLSTSGQRQSMPLNHWHPLSVKNLTGKSNFSSPQASQHFAITAMLNTGITQKVCFVRRPISHRMSHRLFCQQHSMPLKHRHPSTPKNPTGNSFSVTASVTTLFHNSNANYGKYTEK